MSRQRQLMIVGLIWLIVMSCVVALVSCTPKPPDPVAYVPVAKQPVNDAACSLPVRHHSREWNLRLNAELDKAGNGSASEDLYEDHQALQDAAEDQCLVAQGKPPKHGTALNGVR